MREFPLVSIITPVYNGAEYLEELVQSVLQQDYPNIEHLIIDDGSQDDGATVAILKKYSHLGWWSRANKGQYATMNEGLFAARGEIICFVSADDIMSLGAVTTAISFLETHPKLDGAFGETSFIDSYGNTCPYFVPFHRAPISFVAYFAHIPHCSFYIKKSSILVNELFFDTSLRYAGDYDWMIQISQSGLEIGVIDQELSRVRLHPNQTSQRNLEASLVENHEILKRRHVNIFYYMFLKWIYFLWLRLWKINFTIKNKGLKGIVELVSKWWSMKVGSER